MMFSAISIANGLVITGKTLNFLLLCLSSTHFRAKCAMIFFRKFPQVSFHTIKLLNLWVNFKLNQTSFAKRYNSSRSDIRCAAYRSSSNSLHYPVAAALTPNFTRCSNGSGSTAGADCCTCRHHHQQHLVRTLIHGSSNSVTESTNNEKGEYGTGGAIY